MNEVLTLEFDGGSRGNPGPAGVGVVLRAQDGTALVTIGRFIGHATNNVAEYKALIAGLEEAGKLGAKKLVVRGDSELIVKQMRGEYRVRHPELRPLHEKARALLDEFEQARIEHNLREKNTLADRMVNLAIDRRAEVTDANESPARREAMEEMNKGDRWACPRCGCVMNVVQPSRIRPHQMRPPTCVCGAKMNLDRGGS